MKIKYSLESTEAEKFLCILVIGVLESLEKGNISIDEAECLVFRPYMSKFARTKVLKEIILDGCQITDIADLVPEALAQSINGMKAKATSHLQTLSTIKHANYLDNDLESFKN